MKHVVLVNGRFLERPTTGVERVAFETLRAFAKLSPNNDFALPGGDSFELRLVAPASANQDLVKQRANELKLPVDFCGRFSGHVWEQIELPWFAGRRLLLNLCNTAPIIKQNQIVFVHDAGVWAIPHCYQPSFRWWYRTMFNAYALRGAELLTNSQFSAGELSARLGIERSRWTVAHLGAEHASQQAVRAASVDHLVEPGARYILAISSRNPNKNFQRINEALLQIGDDAPRCLVVGQSRNDLFSAQQQASPALHFCGYVSDAELMGLIDGAICLVYPSFYEGFGLPPLEAMARGCPVIASNTSALPETCGGAALYCDPSDTKSIANAIKKVISDDSLRSGYSTAGKTQAGRFRWTETAAVVRGCIEKRLVVESPMRSEHI